VLNSKQGARSVDDSILKILNPFWECKTAPYERAQLSFTRVFTGRIQVVFAVTLIDLAFFSLALDL